MGNWTCYYVERNINFDKQDNIFWKHTSMFIFCYKLSRTKHELPDRIMHKIDSFKFQRKTVKKLVIAVHILQNTYNFVISPSVVVLQETANKCTKIQNAGAEPLFCLLSLLFGDVLIGVTVVVS